MLTNDYNSSKVAEPAKTPAGKGGSSKHDDDDAKSIAKWILGSSAPTDVHVETKWTSLVADQDKLTKIASLKGRIFAGLQVMYEVLPKWTLKDFVVVHRRGDKGVWKGEVWTKRDFEALEILLAPHSSQLKDTHLTGNAHAGVTLPKMAEELILRTRACPWMVVAGTRLPLKAPWTRWSIQVPCTGSWRGHRTLRKSIWTWRT